MSTTAGSDSQVALSPIDYQALPQQPFIGLFPVYQDHPRRHRYEIVLLVLAVILSAFGYLFALIIFISYSLRDPAIHGQLSVAGRYLSWFAFLTLAFPWLVLLTRGVLWGILRMQAVEITPIQFPQAYQWLIEISQRFRLKELPRAYVLLGNGTINAFSSGHGFRRFVVLYSDLFEVGGQARDPDIVKFVMAHEIGHIAAGHTSWWRIVFTQSWSRLPILGPSLLRAQEYTADNHGYAYCPHGAARTTSLLAGGKYLYRTIDPVQFVARARGKTGFFGWFANLLSNHPVNTWRAHALYYRSIPGGLFFRPRSSHLPPLVIGPYNLAPIPPGNIGFPSGAPGGVSPHSSSRSLANPDAQFGNIQMPGFLSAGAEQIYGFPAETALGTSENIGSDLNNSGVTASDPAATITESPLGSSSDSHITDPKSISDSRLDSKPDSKPIVSKKSKKPKEQGPVPDQLPLARKNSDSAIDPATGNLYDENP